jgi:hypothetical protein
MKKKVKGKTQKNYKKVVSERFPISKKRGGGLVKIEVWENETGEVAKYSMAYINPMVFSGDNGRVIGYDNSHNYHHKHYFGEVFSVENFTSYQKMIEQFEEEIQEFII